MAAQQRATTKGFTLTELSVLMGVGAILASVLAADLNQTRQKLLQQACAANLKHWGMAFSMYADDYNGTFWFQGPPNDASFGDSDSPYFYYLGGTAATRSVTMRSMRLCPFTVATTPNDLNSAGDTVYGYSMTIGTYLEGLRYQNADTDGSPFYGNAEYPYWPNLKTCPNGPAKFLLLIDSGGHSMHCRDLLERVSNPNPTDGSGVPAINRHGGAVNCLFGDFHVELISAQVISNQAAIGCVSNSWFALN